MKKINIIIKIATIAAGCCINKPITTNTEADFFNVPTPKTGVNLLKYDAMTTAAKEALSITEELKLAGLPSNYIGLKANTWQTVGEKLLAQKSTLSQGAYIFAVRNLLEQNNLYQY